MRNARFHYPRRIATWSSAKDGIWQLLIHPKLLTREELRRVKSTKAFRASLERLWRRGSRSPNFISCAPVYEIEGGKKRKSGMFMRGVGASRKEMK